MDDDQAPRQGLRPLDFAPLAQRLRLVASLFGVVALAGAVVEGLVSGLTFAVIIRWAVGYVAAALLVTAVLVAVHAYRGADAAQRSGRRLSGPDVGLTPPRRHARPRGPGGGGAAGGRASDAGAGGAAGRRASGGGEGGAGGRGSDLREGGA